MASPKRENKSKTEASAPVQPSADVSAVSAVSVEPRGSRPRPILAAGLALGAVLLFIALLDYQSHQAFFFSGNENLKGSNAIGSLGATFAILLFKFSGIAAFFIPLCIMLAAGFSLWRGVRTLFPWRIPLMISAFCCFAILLSFFDSPDSWMQSREFRDYVPSGGGGTFGNMLYHSFLEIVFGELGSFVLVVIFYAISLLGLVVDNPIRKISARIQWLGNYLKRHFSTGPRRIPAQNSRKRPAEIQTNGTEKVAANASPDAAPTEGVAPQPVPASAETDGPVVPVSDELPDAADHAFLTDPLGPIFPEPELISDSTAAVAAPSDETATESHEPETADTADVAAPSSASETLLFDDFTLPEVVPDGTPDTGTVVRASVLAALAPQTETVPAKEDSQNAPDEPPAEPLSDAADSSFPDSGTPAATGDLELQSASAGKLHIKQEEIIERAAVSSEPKKRGHYQFPPVALLQEPPPAESVPQENYVERAERLVNTLGEFKIKVEMGEIQSGPVITRYEIIPAPGVRVEKIATLANNLAMNLKAESVRVLAPVPGKGTVGIEVPNLKAKAVSLREIIESKAWETLNNKYEIPIVLGKDVTGKPIIENLARMPHCLIAGSTGSGKSVCINAVVASLVYHAGPEDLRFIMVDPKVVELQVYNKLPHMLIPVVTDPKMVPFALTWLIKEMERRYQIFAKTKVKNIAGFNAKLSKNRAEAELARQMDSELSPEERAATAQASVPRDEDVLEIPETKLPYIVCFIDELADLMMVAPADIETGIARLAQLARAAGIHLILATQRPSVNVITGIIKANLPTRIAFKVTSQIDSRTILDQKGAETLIGRGDMLFIPPGGSHLVRAQGAYVSEEEIEALVDHLALCNGEPEFDDAVQDMIADMARKAQEDENDGDMEPSEGTDDPNEDPMLMKSWEVIRATKKVSTSYLQRKLSIGYGRAAKIIDTLEERGYIGPDRGPGNQRDILRD